MEWRRPPRIPKGHCSVHMTVSHRYLRPHRLTARGQRPRPGKHDGVGGESGPSNQVSFREVLLLLLSCRTPVCFSFTLIILEEVSFITSDSF